MNGRLSKVALLLWVVVVGSLAGATRAPLASDQIIYVNDDASGPNGDISWADAFTDLQDTPTTEAVLPIIPLGWEMVFRDDFTTDPNSNGLWEVLHHADVPEDEAVWDPARHHLYLTRAVLARGATIFAEYELTATRWAAQFDYQVTRGQGVGADGFVFMFYKDRASYGEDTGGAATLGFQLTYETGIPGYGLEFDSYDNYEFFDPGPNHIALIQDHISNHLIFRDEVRVEDGQRHRVQVIYNEGLVRVFVDGEQVGRPYQITGPSYTYSGIGFGAGTGGSSNTHMIDNFILYLPRE